MVFIYSYYVNYDDSGTVVTAIETHIKWPGILKFSQISFRFQMES